MRVIKSEKLELFSNKHLYEKYTRFYNLNTEAKLNFVNTSEKAEKDQEL